MLVVGAGVVGLTMAVLLASQGYGQGQPIELTNRVDVMVCEAQDEHKTSRPIPLLLLSRAVEIFQSIGIAEEVQKASERYIDIGSPADWQLLHPKWDNVGHGNAHFNISARSFASGS